MYHFKIKTVEFLMTKKRETISEKLNIVENLIINGQRKEITDVMDGYSYTKVKLQAMEPILTEAKTAVSVQVTEFAEKVASTEAAKLAREQFEPRYTKHLGLLRIIYEQDTAVRMGLKLDERRADANIPFCNQAEQMYITLLNNPAWIIPLKEFSITEDFLREDMLILQEFKNAANAQHLECEESKLATAKRDEILEKLFDWSDRYKKVAKIALKDNANLLGILGL